MVALLDMKSTGFTHKRWLPYWLPYWIWKALCSHTKNGYPIGCPIGYEKHKVHTQNVVVLLVAYEMQLAHIQKIVAPLVDLLDMKSAGFIHKRWLSYWIWKALGSYTKDGCPITYEKHRVCTQKMIALLDMKSTGFEHKSWLPYWLPYWIWKAPGSHAKDGYLIVRPIG